MRKLYLLLVGVVLLATQAMAQRTITGRVVDEKGNPIPNASVLARGTTTGTITKPDGTYSLTVPAGTKALVFSAVDMSPVELGIGTATEINATLKMEDNTMAEVVVTGYGTQQRKAFTGSASKVDVKQFSNLMTPSVDKQLSGRATGVQVTNVGGQINAPARIRIRGINSVTQDQAPLFVIDGVPMITGNLAGTTNSNALADINPADIESIDILKDGASTAIFGSQASGGVIMITTKKGTKGRARFTYDGFIGFTSALKRFDLLDAQQFVTIANEKLTNAGLAPRANMDALGTNTDWQDIAMVENAPIHNHTLSLSGGSDKTTYYMSANYSDQQGIVVSNFNRAYRVRGNLEHEVNKWLKVGDYITISRQEDGDQNNGTNALSGAIASSLRLLPNVSPWSNHFTGYNINWPLGNSMNPHANTTSIDDNFTNVAFTTRENKFYSDKYRVINNFFLELSPIKGLKFRSVFNIDKFSDYSYQGWSQFHGDGYGTSSGGTNGLVVNYTSNWLVWTAQNYINYNVSFKNHNFFLTTGHEYRRSRAKFFQATGTNISDPYFIQQNLISGTASIQSIAGGVTDRAIESFFVRLNYDFNTKYFVQGTFRRDGQSSLAPENRYGNFPGFSVGWRPSNESFWRGSKFLTKWVPEAKLKFSYAETGRELSDATPFLSTFAPRPYGNIAGISVSLVGNPVLKWETSSKYDVGLELGLLNNQFNLVFDWFLNKVDGLVFGVPVPLSGGVPTNQIQQNVGALENRGIELALNGSVLRGRAFTWDFNINYSKVNNKITSLYNIGGVPVPFIENGAFNILKVGEPMNIIYGNVWEGVNSANGHPMYRKADGSLVQLNLSPGGAIGGYYFANAKDDPTLGSASSLLFADRVKLGVPTPTWYGAFTNNFGYKGFGLEVMLRYSGGNHIMNITRQEALMNQSFQNNGVEILERWRTPGQVTNVPKLYYGQGNNINQTQVANSRFVEKGDYLRLQNVVLSYNFSSDNLTRWTNGSVKSLRLYVQGQNLAVWTDYTGADPDNISVLGIDNAVSPQLRIISFGLSVGL